MKHIIFIALLLSTINAQAKEQITFPSLDGVQITADLYMENNNTHTPFIVLFHRAGWSRGEYIDTAPKLNKLGFNCMAIDQRSGGSINLVENITKQNAIKKGKATTYLGAINDMKAALIYARKHFAKGKLIAWGSSYSSALVIEIVGRDNSLADAVLSFSPGEYFAKYGKSSHWISDAASKIKVPVFITSAKREASTWKGIYNAIKSPKQFYLPPKDGEHGSESLWSEYPTSKGYWKAVIDFLHSLDKHKSSSNNK